MDMSLLSFALRASSSSSILNVRPRSSRISTNRALMRSNISSHDTPYVRCAWHRYRRSVILWSFEFLFPAADTTTRRRDGSDSTMSLTLRNWEASATDEPPNFATLSMLQSSLFSAKNSFAPCLLSSAARSCIALTVTGSVTAKT